MKYRSLRPDELQELEREFVRFLASNQVVASDWERMKQENPDKCQQLIEIFSDIVFEKILHTVQLLELKTSNDLKLFRFFEDKVLMLGITFEGNTALDFTKEEDAKEMWAKLQLSDAKLKLYAGERPYRKLREMEIFDLLQAGCLISKNDSLFQTLLQLKQEQDG